MTDYLKRVRHTLNSKQHHSNPTKIRKTKKINQGFNVRIMKPIGKQTFFVIIKLVPIATEPETASNRPMYLSSMVFKFDGRK